MATEEKYLLLLHKSLTGELTVEESRDLQQWRQASDEHDQLAQDYEAIWAQSSGYTPHLNLDVQGDFNQVLARLQQEPGVGSRTISLHGWRRRRLSVAAVFIFLTAAVWVYRQYTLPAGTPQVEMADTSEPYRLIELPDGSKVWLRSGSTLEFPKYFTTSERKVHLKGEAFFQVQHQAGRPFRVHTEGDGMVEVLGTSFQLRTNAQTREQSVLVREGKVRFSPDGQTDGVVLTAGMRASYNPAKRRIQVSQPATFNELAWQTGGLEFVRTPLRQVVADLERHYGVRIELQNPELADCLHTAPLTSQSVEKVLRGLSLTYEFRLEHPEKGRFVLLGGSCR